MKKLIINVIWLTLLVSSCGLAIRETPEEIGKADIQETYRLAVKYYSEGLINEAKFLYQKVIEKYSQLQSPGDKDRKTYLWAIYEIGFIEYSQERYDSAISYFETLFKEAGTFGDRLPQVVLGKRIYLKIKAKKG